MIYAKVSEFQYISCYSLSLDDFFFTVNKKAFQYISCYSLSFAQIAEKNLLLVSIHLMLLFISNHSARALRITQFQYISCYSLSKTKLEFSKHSVVSIHLMLLFIPVRSQEGERKNSFNTSHVTLYPFPI